MLPFQEYQNWLSSIAELLVNIEDHFLNLYLESGFDICSTPFRRAFDHALIKCQYDVNKGCHRQQGLENKDLRRYLACQQHQFPI